MNRNALIMTAMACLTVLFLTTSWAPAQDKPADAQPAQAVGRYQVAAMAYGFLGNATTEKASEKVVVIDSVTGQVWVKESRNTLWRDYGSPAD